MTAFPKYLCYFTIQLAIYEASNSTCKTSYCPSFGYSHPVNMKLSYYGFDFQFLITNDVKQLIIAYYPLVYLPWKMFKHTANFLIGLLKFLLLTVNVLYNMLYLI